MQIDQAKLLNEIVNEQQEDCYYRIKTALTEHFGIEPTSDQMNAFFFQIIEPPYAALRWLDRDHRELVAAIKTVHQKIVDEP